MESDAQKNKPSGHWYVLPSYTASFPNKSTVPACPECKTTKFVASMVDIDSALTSIVCCENGHSWLPSELIDLHLTDAVAAEKYSGEAAGKVIDMWVQEFWTEAKESTDRAFAILTGSILDELLTLMLCAFSIDENQIKDRLLDPGRPLGTFGSKIDACYFFGMISEKDKLALHLIRKIRNDFAHKLLNLSFEDDVIKSRIHTLASILEIKIQCEPIRSHFERCVSLIRTSLLTKITLVKRCAMMPDDPSNSMLKRQAATHKRGDSDLSR